MSAAPNDLTARLRDSVIVECGEAADRIEELEAQIAALQIDGAVNKPRLGVQPEQAPIARVTGYHGGHCIVVPTDPAMALQMNMALYAAPQTADPAPHDAQSELPRRELDALLDFIDENGTTAEGVEIFAKDLCVAYALSRTSDRDAITNAALKRVAIACEEWPLKAVNMERAAVYNKVGGWANAVASVLRYDIVVAIRALQSGGEK